MATPLPAPRPLPRYRLSWSDCDVHSWVNPMLPLAQRRLVIPMIGYEPWKMLPGHVYKCRTCGFEWEVPTRFWKYLKGGDA